METRTYMLLYPGDRVETQRLTAAAGLGKLGLPLTSPVIQ